MILFKDLVIPGKEEEFEYRLGEVLAKMYRGCSDTSTTTFNEELQKLYTKIDLLVNTIPKPVAVTGKPS